MYGYVKTYTPELKVREQEYYRAIYCGLCRTMGRCTGQCSRMTLSYDFTFFALVRMALTGERPAIKRRRCGLHPLRRRPMAEPDGTLALCANLSAILVYHKTRDDVRDERGMKRTAATLVRPYMASIRRRAIQQGLGEADAAVADALRALCELEDACPPTVDEPADCFGNLLGEVLAHGLEGSQATLARKIGRHTGRWVYILDAADDFAADVKAGRYNPLACLYQDPTKPPMTELPEAKRQEIRTALLGELMEIECAFDLLDTSDNPDLGGLLANILYEGMPREAHRVLFGDENEDSAPEKADDR